MEPERSNDSLSSEISHISRGSVSEEILRISIHSTVSAWGGFGRTADISNFPRNQAHCSHGSFWGVFEVTSMSYTASWVIVPSHTIKRVLYFQRGKVWLGGFSLSETVPSQKSQYHVFAPILDAHEKFSAHVPVLLAVHTIPLFVRRLLAVIFVWSSMRALSKTSEVWSVFVRRTRSVLVTVCDIVFGSITVSLTSESCGNFTYHGLHFLSVSAVSNVPIQKFHSHSAHTGTSARKLTWQISDLQTKASSRPLWTTILAEVRSSKETEPPPHPPPLIGAGRPCSWMVRVEIIELSPAWIVSIVSVCDQLGTRNVSGLQSSSSTPKSVEMWHVSFVDSRPSSFGVTRRFILHSVRSGSQVYSDFEVSSFSRRYVGCCQRISVTTLVGSIVVSGGIFLRVIVEVWRIFPLLSSIFIVMICSPVGTMEVFGLQGSVVGTSSKSLVISHVNCDDSAPSSNGVTFKLILHSISSGSQVYSVREVSSFKRR